MESALHNLALKNDFDRNVSLLGQGNFLRTALFPMNKKNCRKGQGANQKYWNLVRSDQQMQRLEEMVIFLLRLGLFFFIENLPENHVFM